MCKILKRFGTLFLSFSVLISCISVANVTYADSTETSADSIMDRIIHNSYEFPTSDNNLRKLYDSKKAQRVIDSL